jgi:hypothetical protein
LYLLDFQQSPFFFAITLELITEHVYKTLLGLGTAVQPQIRGAGPRRDERRLGID